MRTFSDIKATIKKRPLKWAVIFSLVAVGIPISIYVGDYAHFIWEVSKILYERSVYTVSVKNSRGDKAVATVDANSDPYQTKVVFRPAHAWFSTDLVTATNYFFSVGMKWRGDNLLEVQLDLGPEARHSPPVTRVGPVTIVYRWGGPDAPPPAPDIDPYVDCPAPYASLYYAKCSRDDPGG